MRVLITGRGISASFQIRGAQLGAAIGATVEPNAGKVKGYDVAVVVKRPRPDLLHRLSGVPIVWDIVDAWPQPLGNEWDKVECCKWLRKQIETIKPAGIVAATHAMAADCLGFGVPVLTLPHHARPGQKLNPIRERVQTVGYEGGEQYLGFWRQILEDECKVRGWRFVCNPESLSDVDIVVAVRSHKGYAPRTWKSNVKLANAQGSGTPCILNREAGYLETKSGGELWADTEIDLSICLTSLSNHAVRVHASALLQAGTITLESVAATYKTWLQASRFC